MRTTVLIVDDEEDLRFFLSILLQEYGFQVVQAADGDTAFALFKEIHPPIVLTDIKMPGMDGVQLLGKIKAEDKEAEVIMVSGHGDMSLAIESLKHEASDFITKPIDETLLLHALRKAEEKISLRNQLKAHMANLEDLVKEKSERVVELERQMAARQILERLSSAMKIVTDDVADRDYFPEIPCFISIHNARLEVVAANELYTRTFGDRVGARSWEIYRESREDNRLCPAAQALAERLHSRLYLTAIAADGTELPVAAYALPIRGSSGDIQLIIETAVDMTGIQKLQDQLQWTQFKYQNLFDEAPCYITIQDRTLCITEANRRFKEAFGDHAGMSCFHTYKHREEPCQDCPVAKTFEDGLNHQAETTVTTRTGEPMNILVWTAPLVDSQGVTTHVMEMSTNITPIRQLQDHITSLGIMLGSMSHGMKGMLTAIDGGVYRVDEGLSRLDLEEVRSGWAIVSLRIERLKKMVSDILYYSKSRDLELTSVALRGFVEELAALIESRAQKAGISFLKELSGAAGDFEADVVALSSALTNFLENAVDACEMDRSKGEHTIRFSSTRKDDSVIFEIADNGIGMDHETMDRMFTLFFSSKGSRGTGIGLFVSSHVIKQHSGKVTVDSEYGKGTRVRIEIPSKQPVENKPKGEKSFAEHLHETNQAPSLP